MNQNMPKAGINRDGDGKFATSRLGEQNNGSLGRPAASFPAPNPQYRSLNHVHPGLLERTPAPLPTQTFRNGRQLGDRSSFATVFDDQFRALDSYESLFGPYERSARHLNARNLALAGFDPATAAHALDLRHTDIHQQPGTGELRVRAWMGVNPNESGLKIPPSAEYGVDDQHLAALALRFDGESLHNAQQLRASIAQGKVAPWAILSPTEEQLRYIDERTSGASTAATTTGVAHTRLVNIQEALQKLENVQPLDPDWKLDVGMDLVRERATQIRSLEEIRNKRKTANGVDYRYLLEDEQALYERFSATSRKMRDVLGLEEMKARDQMNKMIETNDAYQHYTWESGFPGEYGSAPRLPKFGK